MKSKSQVNFKRKVFNYNEFNVTCFVNFIMENFHLNSNYSILMKFGFNGNSLFYLSGKQGRTEKYIKAYRSVPALR